jgi:hypothetical protein
VNTLFKGKKELILTEEWQALPSLDPNEILLDIAINGLKKDNFQIKYSRENHLYYIRLTEPLGEPKSVSVDLLLRMSTSYQKNVVFNTLTSHSVNQEIHCLLMKYLKFDKDDGKLRNTIGITAHNGYEYLNEARKLAVGSCRLRAIAFKEEMQRLYHHIPVSIVVNADHCFIEMEQDGFWQRYCLGGYRDTPTFAETVRKNTLAAVSCSSKNNRFFADLNTQQPLSKNHQNQGNVLQKII